MHSEKLRVRGNATVHAATPLLKRHNDLPIHANHIPNIVMWSAAPVSHRPATSVIVDIPIFPVEQQTRSKGRKMGIGVAKPKVSLGIIQNANFQDLLNKRL